MKNKEYECTVGVANCGISLYFPSNFPEYETLCQGKEVYFIDNGHEVFMSFTKPNGGAWYCRKVQKLKTSKNCNFRVAIPNQIVLSFQVVTGRKMKLIHYIDKDRYLCSFEEPKHHHESINPHTNEVSVENFMKFMKVAYKTYCDNQLEESKKDE